MIIRSDMDTLKGLYSGGIRPSERTVKDGSEYQQLQHQASALEDAFRAELSAEGKKAYDAYVEKQIALMDIDNCDMFIKGYRLGVKLLLAALMEYDTPLPQI